MAAVRDALWRAATGLALLIGSFTTAPASAASSTFSVPDQAVISVVGGARATIQVHGWDRPNVQFDTDDEAVQVTRRNITFGTAQNPLTAHIPLANAAARDPVSGTVTRGTLAPEEFPYASDFRPGSHDVVHIVVAANAHITLWVPSSVALLNVRVRGVGNLSVSDYHGGTLFAGAQGGNAQLTGVLTAAFVQMLTGSLDVVDSSFDRLRARGNSATMTFEHSRARQIEVTTISGNVVWDNGTFDPGLARFESTYGSIAIGVAGGAQVSARSNDGRVYSLWDRRTPITQRSEGEASAIVGAGGPVVNAVTGRGNVYLYDGELDTRRVLPPEWQLVRLALHPHASYQQPLAQPLPQRQPLPPPPPFARYRRLPGRI